MAERFGPEAADFQIVLHHTGWAAELVDRGREKAFLVIEARSPGEHATDVESFTIYLKEHIFWSDPFTRSGVMSATGAVDVVIAAKKAICRGVDPAFKFDAEVGRGSRWDFDFPAQFAVFWTAA